MREGAALRLVFFHRQIHFGSARIAQNDLEFCADHFTSLRSLGMEWPTVPIPVAVHLGPCAARRTSWMVLNGVSERIYITLSERSMLPIQLNLA